MIAGLKIGVLADLAVLRPQGEVITDFTRGGDRERGELLRRMVEQMSQGDTLLLAAGRTFDLNGVERGSLRFPDGIRVASIGAGNATLVSAIDSDQQGPAYEICGLQASGVDFVCNTVHANEDPRCIQFRNGRKRDASMRNYEFDAAGKPVYEATVTVPYAASFHACAFYSPDWAVYDWSGIGNEWSFRRCDFSTGRQAISLMSNNPVGAQVLVDRCVIEVDTSWSKSTGHTSHRTWGGGYGVVCRGGEALVRRSVLMLRGSSQPGSAVPNLVGLWDGNGFGGSPAGSPRIVSIDNTFESSVEEPLVLHKADVWATDAEAKARLMVIGGKGNGPNGTVAIEG